MDSQIVTSATAIACTLGGALIGFFSQRDAKKTRKLEEKVVNLKGRVERYREEIVARIALERVAMSLLHTNKLVTSEGAAQDLLRNEAQSMCGFRPSLAPRDVKPNKLIAMRERIPAQPSIL